MITEPHGPGSTGKVYLKVKDGDKTFNAEYFPSVIGAGWQEDK